ncbi:hypothetical protein SS50377_22079 [Spironucleus salmonicida]|uniref:Uncharacterized protein n=1 Tax=Spironucleus salmonicida TaxID=348837 RepID=V6LY84_9EUKA|nr:hypothetical protein SS50377_22079 [Spironucleus salmonicida]|eukprot:EST45759.1 Hypothetical protein SS50377_14330 [Spironucleus salmonicida]
MNHYDLAKLFLNNPGQLEYQCNATRQELRQLLFLQSQKALSIQQGIQQILSSMKQAEVYTEKLKQYKQYDLQLLEQVGYALNAANLTAKLLKNLCMIPIQVTQLKLKLQEGGYSQIQQQIRAMQQDISDIKRMAFIYQNDLKTNNKFIQFEQMQKVIQSFDSYFHMFDIFQESTQDWLIKRAPSEILLQVSRGYEHFLDSYIHILLQQEKIEPLSLGEIWKNISQTIYTTIGQYFTSIDFLNIDFKLLKETLFQYYQIIDQIIGKLFEFDAPQYILTNYGTLHYSQKQNLSFHSHFPIKRVYACAIHNFLSLKLLEFVSFKINNQQLSVDFIVKLFDFVEVYNNFLIKYKFNYTVFQPIELLKLQQLQIDPPFSFNLRPYQLIQIINTGQLKGGKFNRQQNYSLKSVQQPLIEIAEHAFKLTFDDFWNDKTSDIERIQILEQIQGKDFFVQGLTLESISQGIEEEFKKSIKQKFFSLIQTATSEYSKTLASPQQLNNKFRTTIPSDFSSIFNMNLIGDNHSFTQIKKLNFIVFQEASDAIYQTAAQLNKKIQSSLPRLNFQSLIGISDNLQFKNFFFESDYKKTSNQNLFKVLLRNQQNTTNQLNIQRKQEIEFKDPIHKENQFDFLPLNSLIALCNDFFVFQQMLQNLSLKIDNQDSDDVLQKSAFACMDVITSCCARISYIICQKNTLNNKILKIAFQDTELRLEPICNNIFRQQYVKTTFGVEFAQFLWKMIENKKLNELDDNYIDIYGEFGKKLKELEEVCVSIKIRPNDLKNCIDELRMFQSREINYHMSLISICVYFAKNDQNYEEFIQQKGKSKIKMVQDWNFYRDCGVVERVVKRFIEE